MSVKKTEEVLARDLGEALKTLLPAVTNAFYSASVDTNGDPTIAIGTQTTGSQNAFLRVTREAIGGVDSLGLAQRVYQPHVLQIALESSATAGQGFLNVANFSALLSQALDCGVKVELYLRATGALVTVADITPANLVQTLWPDIFNKMKNAV